MSNYLTPCVKRPPSIWQRSHSRRHPPCYKQTSWQHKHAPFGTKCLCLLVSIMVNKEIIISWPKSQILSITKINYYLAPGWSAHHREIQAEKKNLQTDKTHTLKKGKENVKSFNCKTRKRRTDTAAISSPMHAWIRVSGSSWRVW